MELKNNTRYRAYKFSLSIVILVRNLPRDYSVQIISNQLLRSATSIGANLIEAKASSSKRDFIKFYQIALKSANETQYWLCLMRDSKIIEYMKAKSLINEVCEISRMIGSSLLTLKGKKQK